MTMRTIFNENSSSTGCHIFRCVICWKYIFESDNISLFGDGYCHKTCMYSVVRQSKRTTCDRQRVFAHRHRGKSKIRVKTKRPVNKHHGWYHHTFGMKFKK